MAVDLSLKNEKCEKCGACFLVVSQGQSEKKHDDNG